MNVPNNYVEKIILTRKSYDELHERIADLDEEIQVYKKTLQKAENQLEKFADEIHALKQLLLKNSIASDWIFKENSLEKVLDFESPFCGIDYTKLKELRKLISDEEIEIAIEMRWRKLNNKEEECEDVMF